MTKRKTIPHKMDDGYFDLNIPYTTAIEKGKHPVTKRKTRIKLVTKLIELGYTGIAYNHSIKATAVSDSDSCSISLAPLSSILTLSPNLFASVKFHRDLLRVPLDTPFRQYTRLTVSVDSLIQAASLNSGNPVLKSYDLVAVKPLNQHVFDHVCKVAVVDLIAIDFSEKLPFRLNLPIVKAAMKRGIYFEITYSHLVADVQTRRQMILNAKVREFTSCYKGLSD
ncbi:hypothetical protein IFM89_020406 [Coptis chinensis]|uniref:Uncharacterized protein n=1 Tax=Coptis chinensis TaxID=261450 RepID=A0A835HD33_9MAGN|nr:hypothetical protein IFM89_020406 [Coptis chinensis]